VKISKDALKRSSPFIFIILSIITLIFLFFGVIIALASFNNIRFGIRFTDALFLIIGIYAAYEAYRYLSSLYKNKKKFEKIFIDFFEKNEIRIYLTALISLILLSIFYFTEFYFELSFIVNVILYLPLFVLNNLTFIVTIFLKSNNLGFLNFAIDSILPIAQIIYIYKIIGFFFRKKKSFK
jgi:hypothetical protein